MRHASVWLLAPIIALSSLTLFACGDDGGGDDDDGSSGSGGSTASGGSSSGGQAPSTGNVDGSTRLTAIDTDAEAQAACQRAASQIDEEDLEAALEGACTFQGLIGELLQSGDCETIKAQCLAEGGGPDDPSTCTAEDFPDCDITLDAYIACSLAQAQQGSEIFRNLTCSSDLTSLPTEAPETPAACVSVYDACPELMPDLGE